MKILRKVNKMKSNTKSRIIILIALGIIFALSPIITVNLGFVTGSSIKSLEYSDDINFDNKNPKISAVSGKIHIDNNWTVAKSAGICTGDGTYSDPYVIEDLVIDTNNTGSCILIENSTAYFRIENCTVFNSEGAYNAGILLNNTDNGFLIDNNCSSNSSGMGLFYSDNNTISGNDVNNNECIEEVECNENIFENNDCGIIFLILIISGVAILGIVTILLIKHVRKRKQ